jgi:hypothetical protein
MSARRLASGLRGRWLIAACVGLAAAGGCEGLERKLIRKPKVRPKPTPIVAFTDYTRTITPLDRYRKHAVLFDYWNGELLKELGETAPNQPVNQKRLRRMSAESVSELKIMRGLVTEAAAGRFEPVLAERERLDREIQSSTVDRSRIGSLRQRLEDQARRIRRDLFWREVQDHLVSPDG